MKFDRTLQIRTDIEIIRTLNLLDWMQPRTIYWFLRDNFEGRKFFGADYDCCTFGESQLMELGATNMWWDYTECPWNEGSYHPKRVGTSLKLISKAPPKFPKSCLDKGKCFPIMPPEARGVQPIDVYQTCDGFVDAQLNTWMLKIWLANITLAVQPIGWYNYIREDWHDNGAWSGRPT
eukprot:c15361_g1_i1.p2 GENE.c15361_g1_i1~~c15361_g1_i1.p2  ORF type:complete len:178 (+),score=34.26 c15361_g1_i1:693-1226(+)